MAKTYLPQFAKTMHYLGKYAYEHKAKLYTAIDEASQLNDEQKQAAKKAVDDVLESHDIFKRLWIDYTKGKL